MADRVVTHEQLVTLGEADTGGKVPLPAWAYALLVAVSEAAIDLLADVNWRTILSGFIVAVMGLFGVGKAIQNRVQSYAEQAAVWGGAVARAEVEDRVRNIDQAIADAVAVARRMPPPTGNIPRPEREPEADTPPPPA